MVRLRRNVNDASAPSVWFDPSELTDCDRLVKSTPTLLCLRMSRLSRTTEKFVAGAPIASSARCWMLRAPTV